jgi:hypothetical protein
MLSLSHRQLQHVMDAARGVPIEKREQFLQRISTMLELKGRFDDADVADVAKLWRRPACRTRRRRELLIRINNFQ